jgi:diadenosine tetraphosphate (Ap4A) HIT family hydrolase
MSEGCVFCDQSWMRAAEIFIETPHCLFASTHHPAIRAGAGLADGILPGSGAIVPIVHRTSVFDLTPAEWADTQDLLLRARTALHELLAPETDSRIRGRQGAAGHSADARRSSPAGRHPGSR